MITFVVCEEKKLQIGIKKRPENCEVKSKSGDMLFMHYTGTLEDGTKFDSSLDRGQPLSFTLGAGQVIRGWDQGLLGYVHYDITLGVRFHPNISRLFSIKSRLNFFSLDNFRMCVGEKRKLVIPPEMGYGSNGAPPTIPRKFFVSRKIDSLS